MLSAVIFDLDGTLVDLLDLHYETFREIVKLEYGLDFSREDFEKYYGKTAEDIIRPFFEKHSVKGVDYAAFARERRDTLFCKLREGYKVKVLPGARELLEELKNKKVKMALATGNPKKSGKAILESAGMEDYFQAEVFRDDITKGKPAPDMFLLAAERLGAPPEECVVIEDSIYGVLAAKAAGMKVIAVSTETQSKRELEDCKPDALLPSLKGLRLEDIKAKFDI